MHEAAAQAGGRCRSYYDPALGMAIDNGNHLLLSGNRAALDYLARDRRARPPGRADAAPISRSSIWRAASAGRCGSATGRLPWWIFDASRRVPGHARRRLSARSRGCSGPAAGTIGEAIACTGPLYDRLCRPLAARRAEHRAAARPRRALAARVLRETLARGRPRLPAAGRARRALGTTFIDPALRFLAARGADDPLRHAAARAAASTATRVAALDFGDERSSSAPDDARHSRRAAECRAAPLVPDLTAPDEFRGHRQRAFPRRAAGRPCRRSSACIDGTPNGSSPIPDRLSVTISGADPLCRHAARGAGPDDLARGRARRRPAPSRCRHGRSCASGARPSRTARAGTPAAAGAKRAMAQSVARRRLDRDRLAGDDRRRHPLGRARRRPALPPEFSNDDERHRRPAARATADSVVRRARRAHRGDASALLARAAARDGHWVFELEADTTIPAEYVLLRHYLGEPVELELERKIARLSAPHQAAHGGWPLFHDGGFDISASVKAYFALKMIGDRSGRAAHGARPRGHPCARRRGQQSTCSRASCSRSTASCRGAPCR